MMLAKRIRLTDEAIREEGVFSTTVIPYQEIETIDLTNPMYVMQVHRNDQFWPALSLTLGVAKWRELVDEIIERAPESVKVEDPGDRLDWASAKRRQEATEEERSE
jgi:hypothetical protein